MVTMCIVLCAGEE